MRNLKERSLRSLRLMQKGVTGDDITHGWQEPWSVSWSVVELLRDRKLIAEKDRKGERMAEHDGNFKGAGWLKSEPICFTNTYKTLGSSTPYSQGCCFKGQESCTPTTASANTSPVTTSQPHNRRKREGSDPGSAHSLQVEI